MLDILCCKFRDRDDIKVTCARWNYIWRLYLYEINIGRSVIWKVSKTSSEDIKRKATYFTRNKIEEKKTEKVIKTQYEELIKKSGQGKLTLTVVTKYYYLNSTYLTWIMATCLRYSIQYV